MESFETQRLKYPHQDVLETDNPQTEDGDAGGESGYLWETTSFLGAAVTAVKSCL